MVKPETVNIPKNMQVETKTAQTRGEKVFDFFTYKIINFGFNEILSLGITDLFLGGTDRQDGKATSYFANKFGFTKTSDGLYNLQNLLDSKAGKTGGAVFTLNLGGHITAAIVKILENNRSGLSRRFDNIIDKFNGTKKNQAIIDAREARYEYIKKHHAKSWGQVIKGRLAGMLASMALNQIPETIDDKLLKNKPTEGHYGVRRMTGWAGNKIDKPIIAALEKRNGGEISDMAKKRASYWSELILFETWCTAITSVVMEAVVKWKERNKKPETAKLTNIANNETTNSSKPEETPSSKVLASSSTSRFTNEQGDEKKRWTDKGYDYEDEVGIGMNV